MRSRLIRTRGHVEDVIALGAIDTDNQVAYYGDQTHCASLFWRRHRCTGAGLTDLVVKVKMGPPSRCRKSRTAASSAQPVVVLASVAHKQCCIDSPAAPRWRPHLRFKVSDEDGLVPA